MIRTVLTVAGSDSSGGAGIQADIKTISAHGMYAMSVITALTAQNTTGVYGVETAAPELVGKQLDCIFEDIFPDAVKIGMLANAEITKVVAARLKKYGARNIVIDPVMVSTSGSRLIAERAVGILKTELFPLGRVITPNIPEAEVLCGFEITDKESMLRAAETISRSTSGAVLIKGGHMENEATDLLYDNGSVYSFTSKRVDTKNTHGTGCTLSSAIACGLADGMELSECVETAKKYITGALESGLDLGRGCGPLNHMYLMRGRGCGRS